MSSYHPRPPGEEAVASGIPSRQTRGPATVTGNLVTLTGIGTVVLSASQAASGNYTAATTNTSFTVTSGFTITANTGTSAGGSVTTATTTPGGMATYSLTIAICPVVPLRWGF